MATESSPLPRDAERIFRDALRAVQADRLLARVDWAHLADRPLGACHRVEVLAVGKAALPMARTARRALVEHVAPTALHALAVVPHGYRDAEAGPVDPVEIIEAGHPVPDASSVAAARRALDVARAADVDTLLVVLISGGASALWSHGPDGVLLADLQATARLLLHGGATIHEMNTVRKHLSAIAGGRLAVAAHPATVRALVVSDVVGDDPSVIGSGPTVADPSTFGDAIDALRRLALWLAVPAAVRDHLERGREGRIAETPDRDDPRLATARTVVVGRNADALEAAQRSARQLGYATQVEATPCVGEARGAGAALARRTLEQVDAVPTCRLSGGETTVVVRGRGRGGRNQELALAAAIALDVAAMTDARATPHADVAILSGGTDGIDGPTDAAGGCVTGTTAGAMRRAGIEPAARLDDNDAYAALDAVHALVRTGPTHTNVMDLQVVLTRPAPAS